MITFLDEAGREYGALSEVKLTNAVNGERSLTGDIYTNPNVLNKIDKGWRLRFGDEYFVVTYAKPVDNGRKTQVSFDAVHQFFWDFQKNPVYSQLSDGSHTFQAYLDFIFDGSGYSYAIDSGLKVKAFEKQSFGMKNRLTLFNDIIKASGVEFAINGKVVRILAHVGTDLSTIVRKNFNMSDFKIEKNIGNFITYQKGFGAWKDSEDHSKGRLEVEYESPLAKVYGQLSTDPVVDERYTQKDSLLAVLKENVDNSYTISVGLSMEDLTRAGYSYTKPIAGDYIMAINEQIGFHEKIRIVSFTSSYDVRGQLIEHTVTCNDLGTVQKQTATYSKLSDAVAANAESSKNAVVLAQQAMVSADGKNRVYFGITYPADVPKGTLTKGDQLYLTVGDQVKMYYWNGAEWLPVPVVNDVERFKADIAQQFSDVNQQMAEQQQAHDRAVAEILSQAESAQSLAAQAKTIGDQAKADAVNLASQLNTAKTALQNSIANAKSQADAVANNLATAKSDLQNQVAAIDAKAVQAQRDITQAKSDLQTQAAQLNAQATKQVELTKLTTDTKKLADGTLTSLNELSKTVDKNSGDITSVTNRTKVVEDDLSGTKTKLEQVKVTADTTSRKTAEIQAKVDGVTERFENLQIGSTNHFLNSDFENGLGAIWQSMNIYSLSVDNQVTLDGTKSLKVICLDGSGVNNPKVTYPATAKLKIVQSGRLPDVVTISFFAKTDTDGMILRNRLGFVDYTNGTDVSLSTDWKKYAVKIKTNTNATNEWIFRSNNAGIIWIAKPQFEFSSTVSDYSKAEEDFSNQIAEYKRTADQNYSGLQSTISTLDGKITQNKSEQVQTAEAFKTRLSSLETYKNTEGTRAQAYFEAAKTETAKQITAERTAIANNYVAKSTYQEDAAGVTRRLTATETVANTVKTNLATYQETNDRRVAALETAKSSTDGTLTQLSNKVEQNAQQTRETISAVESKIPTVIGTRNYLLATDKQRQLAINMANGYVVNDVYHLADTLSNIGFIAGDVICLAFDYVTTNKTAFTNFRVELYNTSQGYLDRIGDVTSSATGHFTGKLTLAAKHLAANMIKIRHDNTIATFTITKARLNAYTFADWSLADEDIVNDISNAKLDIVKTADGLKLTANKVEGHEKSLAQHTTQITALNNELSAKVSKTDYDKLTGRMTNAETTIQVQAGEISKRLTSTQVESAITAKGYQTKADVDSNITGRGYITNTALQPYVTATVLENKVKETSERFDRTISETKALIPTEMSGNLLLESNVGWKSRNYLSKEYQLIGKLEEGKTYTLTIHWWRSPGTSDNYVPMVYYNGGNLQLSAPFSTTQLQDTPTQLKYDAKIDSWVVTFTVKPRNSMSTEQLRDFDKPNPTIRIYRYGSDIANQNNNQSTAETAASFATLVKGSTALSVWQPAFSELTTVTAFNNVSDTVDHHTQTLKDQEGRINTVLQTATTAYQLLQSGGSIYEDLKTVKGQIQQVRDANYATRIETLAGSWAVKNLTNAGTVLNQLNLNKDGSVRIDGKLVQITGQTYIENGVIKDAMISNLNAGKITAGTLDASKVNVINLNASNIVSGTLSANLIKGGTLTSMNGNTTFDLNNGGITFNNNYAYIKRKSKDNSKTCEIITTENDDSTALEYTLRVRTNDYKKLSSMTIDLRKYTDNVTMLAQTSFVSDVFTIKDSDNKLLVSIYNSKFLPTTGMLTNWDYYTVCDFYGGVIAKDFSVNGKIASIKRIIEILCDKAGLMWI